VPSTVSFIRGLSRMACLVAETHRKGASEALTAHVGKLHHSRLCKLLSSVPRKWGIFCNFFHHPSFSTTTTSVTIQSNHQKIISIHQNGQSRYVIHINSPSVPLFCLAWPSAGGWRVNMSTIAPRSSNQQPGWAGSKPFLHKHTLYRDSVPIRLHPKLSWLVLTHYSSDCSCNRSRRLEDHRYRYLRAGIGVFSNYHYMGHHWQRSQC
jgi:hypothetical protein